MIKLKYYLLAISAFILLFFNDRLKNFIKTTAVFSYQNLQLIEEHLFWLFDYYLSFAIFILMILIIGVKWNSLILNKKITLFKGLGFCTLMLVMLFPLMSGHNIKVDRNNLAIAKMPPLSVVKYFSIIDNSELKTAIDNISNLSDVNKNEQRIYFSEFNGNEIINYKMNGKKKSIELDRIRKEKGKPIIGKRMFILGTDEYNQDLFIEIVYGVRKSIYLAMIAVIVSVFIGSLLGYLSAVNENIFGIMINRIAEAFFSIPSILILIVAIMFWKNSVVIVGIIMGLFGWITIFKIQRNEIILVKQKYFYITSSKIGLSAAQLMMKEILPYISGQIFLNIIFLMVTFILTESSLSFIGLTSGGSYTSLGALIQRGNFYLATSYWIGLFPSVALALIIIVLNYIKNILRKIIDPRII